MNAETVGPEAVVEPCTDIFPGIASVRGVVNDALIETGIVLVCYGRFVLAGDSRTEQHKENEQAYFHE
jgi:hypothetical protein